MWRMRLPARFSRGKQASSPIGGADGLAGVSNRLRRAATIDLLGYLAALRDKTRDLRSMHEPTLCMPVYFRVSAAASWCR